MTFKVCHSVVRLISTLLALSCLTVGCHQASEVDQDGSGYKQLSFAIASTLEAGWASECDVALTAAYYESSEEGLQMRDLNGDGVPEAICRASMAVYEPGKPQWIGGIRNAPLLIFHRIDDHWYLVLETNGVQHRVTDKAVNGWLVLLSTWDSGGAAETSTAVMVYEQNRYKTVHTYVQRHLNE